jgi:hypothetical protein
LSRRTKLTPARTTTRLPLDDEIVELWKELSPSSAYALGWNKYAGRLFIPSEAKIQGALTRVRELRARAETELQAKILDALETTLLFDEPQPVLDDIVGTIFAHLTKEGINVKHLLSLVSDASQAIDETARRFSSREIPAGVKALALYRLDGILEILDSVRHATGDEKLQTECEALKTKAGKFIELFALEGFGEGTFEQIENVFGKYKFDLGREKFYQDALKKGFDYHEAPEELEARALAWLDDELPRFHAVLKKLAREYDCEPTSAAVEKKIIEKGKLKTSDLVATTNAIRRVIQRFADERIVRINKKYKTRVIETPSYLTGTLPTGAAGFYDTFTKHPFQIYYVTTDPKRDPAKSIGQLLDLLVHEEYGHCVHHSNSALHFGGKASTLELINTSLEGPITEGLSFNREREFLEAVKSLETKKTKLSKAEEDYVRLMKRFGGLHLVNLEAEEEIRKWRVIRFLRVIGDVRINTGKQGLLEFVEWAHRYTGVSKSSVFYQLFPAHEGIFPGYATCYAVVGEEIHSIEKKIKDEKKRIRFSTYMTGIGYPPRSIFKRRLEEFARVLTRGT